MEDGEPIFPFNTSSFDITDDDNILLLRATLTLDNTGIATGVNDQLLATPTSSFNVTGNGGTLLVIEAIGPRRLLTTHDDFETFLQTVHFTTNDQAPHVVRNLSLVVEEHPLGEAPSRPAVVPIMILPVNDRPILNSTQRSRATLDDYLQINPGFYPSFLLADTDVIDIDRSSPISQDFIGLAIISAQAASGSGVWQYWNGTWSDFPAISDCFPLLVAPEERVRFVPLPSYVETPGSVSERAALEYRAWDGSSRELVCVNRAVDNTSSGTFISNIVWTGFHSNIIWRSSAKCWHQYVC